MGTSLCNHHIFTRIPCAKIARHVDLKIVPRGTRDHEAHVILVANSKVPQLEESAQGTPGMKGWDKSEETMSLLWGLSTAE